MKNDQPLSLSSPLLSRGALIAVWLALTIGVVGYYVQARWLAVLTVVLGDALVAAAWMSCAGLLGGFVLARLRVSASRGLFWVTSIGLGMGLYSLILLGLGLAGWLNQASVCALLGLSVLLGASEIVWVCRGSLSTWMSMDLSQWFLQPAGWNWLWLATVFSMGVAVVGASILPGFLWKPDDPHPYDVLIYHLQVPREWFEIGRIVPLHHNIYSFFPFNIEMHYLGLMHLQGGPWAGMYTSQFLSLLMAGVFVATMAIEAGIIAGVLAALLPWVVMTGCVCYVESGLLMFAGLAIVWAMRSKDEGRRMKDEKRKEEKTEPAARASSFVLAGVFCGLAAGVKLTALPMLAGALGIGMLLVRSKWATIKGLVLFSVMTLVFVSPWLMRNYAWSGNPVFPLALNILGKGHFTDRQAERFTKAHQAPARQQPISERLKAADGEILRSWKYGYVLWPLAIMGAALGWRRRETWALLLALSIMLIIWLTATHLVSRFFVLGIPVGLLLIGNKPADCNLRAWCGGEWATAALGCIGILIALCAGMTGMSLELERFLPMAADGLYGLTDLSVLDPPELQPWKESAGVLCKVGDSPAFWLQVPISRVKYRSPFDVDDSKGDALQAWLGEGVDRNKVWMLIDPPELQRLHDTYGTPIPDVAYGHEKPFLIAPGGAK